MLNIGQLLFLSKILYLSCNKSLTNGKRLLIQLIFEKNIID